MNAADPPSERLARLVRKRRRVARVNLDPATAHEAVTRQMVEDLIHEVAAMRQRVDMMFYVVIGSIAVDALTRLVAR